MSQVKAVSDPPAVVDNPSRIDDRSEAMVLRLVMAPPVLAALASVAPVPRPLPTEGSRPGSPNMPRG